MTNRLVRWLFRRLPRWTRFLLSMECLGEAGFMVLNPDPYGHFSLISRGHLTLVIDGTERLTLKPGDAVNAFMIKEQVTITKEATTCH